jgi:hypothetical protein
VAELIAEHRAPALGGRTLRSIMPVAERTPARLAQQYRAWVARPELLRDTAPTLAFAVLGQARHAGVLTPEDEGRIVGDLLTHWALRSTLDIAQLCAAASPSRRLPPPAVTPIRLPPPQRRPTERRPTERRPIQRTAA